MSRDFSIAAAVFIRDMKITLRSGGSWFHALFFFTVFTALSAITGGPELSSLRTVAPASVWLAFTFSVQFAASGIFDDDLDDGTLLSLAAGQCSLLPYCYARAGVILVLTVFPALVVAPFMFAMFGIDLHNGLKGACLILAGAPALVLIAILTAAIVAGLRTGGLLGAVIALPFSVPVLVFGVQGTETVFGNGLPWPPEVLILGAFSLFITAVAPPLTVAVLRACLE